MKKTLLFFLYIAGIVAHLKAKDPLIGPRGTQKMSTEMNLSKNAMEVNLRTKVNQSILNLRNIEAKSRRSVSAFVREQQILTMQANNARTAVMRAKENLENYLNPKNGIPAKAMPMQKKMKRSKKLSVR